MRIQKMEVLGINVADLDAAIVYYEALFGIEFLVFTPDLDYKLSNLLASPNCSAPPRPKNGRIAIDKSGCFELLEMPGTSEGFRNIHFRVDDIDAARNHLVAHGLHVVKDLSAGVVREMIFDSKDLNGIRLCIIQYEGASFADALAVLPRPNS